MAESFLNRREVFKNVGVIEFEIVEDGDLGQVVDELAALVEKGRVVFVALDDEPLAVREARALAEVVRNAADEERRVQLVVLEDPGEQRGRARLAVRAADHDDALAAHEKFLEQLRQRAVTQLVLEHGFHLGIAPRNGIADHDEVGLVREVLLRVRRHHFNLPLGQKGGHGRIHVGVRAGDGEALLLHGGGGGSHGSAADADEMNGANLIGKHCADVLRSARARQEKVAEVAESLSE